MGFAAGADVLRVWSCLAACQASARKCDKQYNLVHVLIAGLSCAKGLLLQTLGWTVALYA